MESRYAGLGYVGVRTPDPSVWLDFATEICGLMPSARAPRPHEAAPEDDGTLYLKMDDHDWRIAVHPGSDAGLEYLGFELRTEAAFAETIDEVQKRGASLRSGSAAEIAARRVEELAILEDPAGHRLELFVTPRRDGGFLSPTGTSFLTGRLGMGHAVLYVPDIEAALDFYRGTLGFERSDYTVFGPGGMGIHFLRCTERHHSVALLQIGDLSGLQHLMLETTEIDHVGKALDRALARQIPITSGLGRHRNDRTVSFYMQGPTGFDVEIGWDGVLIDENWIENEFAGGADEWGHHGLDAEALKPR